MSAATVEFARGLELVCRHINPPVAPLPEPIPLPYLGLDGVELRADDPGLAYRYLRGLEIPGTRGTLSKTKPIWAAERGLIAPVSAALEVEPGILAIGDATGVIRLFVRAGRARWECAAAMPAHWDAVRGFCRLEPGGFASVGADGQALFFERDRRGSWQLASPRLLNVNNIPLNAVCQLADGTVLAGGEGGRWLELARLPSGDWEERATMGGFEATDILAIALLGDTGYCTLQSGRLVYWVRDAGSVRSVPVPPGEGLTTDVAEWGRGVIACTEAGELLHYWNKSAEGPDSLGMDGGRAASARMQAVRALDPFNIVTWSEDQQIRVWKQVEERNAFTLRAAFPATLPTPRSFAVLCDGRVAYSESRGFSIAAPQLDGTWRSGELVSATEAPVTAVAALKRDSVAFVQGTALHILSDTIAGPLRVTRLALGHATVRPSLAALGPAARDPTVQDPAAQDSTALVIGGADGRISLVKLESDGWKVTEVRTAHRGLVEHLSAAARHLASADANGLVAHWDWSEGRLLPGATFEETAPVLALAVDAEGRIATATRDGVVVRQFTGPSESAPNEIARLSAMADCIALAWDSDALLAIDGVGAVTRIRLTPTLQLTPERQGWPSPARAMIATVVMRERAVGVESQVVYARGTATIEIGPNTFLGPPHGAVNGLSTADDVLYVAADALYIGQPSANPAVLRRIVVTPEALVEARLNPAGAVISAVMQRLDGQAWSATTIGGKAVPSDPVLHGLVAAVEGSGQLGEISGTDDYTLSADGRELHIRDIDAYVEGIDVL